MANEEHLSILRQSVAVWNQWRKDNSEVMPDLSKAELHLVDLSSANLSDADLRSTDLSKADLRSADLSSADLISANLRSADLISANLRSATLNSANLNSADLSSATLYSADLSDADLRSANLRSANLISATLYSAKLISAKLISANFSYANLSYAKLSYANLSYATLYSADLSSADLSSADLSSADLSDASLRSANLRSAKLIGTQIGWTVLVNIDLSEVKGLETIVHSGPSSIGIDTIYRSRGNISYKFLVDAGIPKDDIAYLLSLAGKAIDFYSCFISYSTKDQAFAERLHADLQAKGVRCWYAPEDLTIGEPFLLGIDKGIRLHDKLLLVLSEHSVASGWIQHEVLSAMAKEQGKEPWVLFPIRVDDTVMDTHVPWANMIRQARHIGDFTRWKDHDAYQKAFDRLLRDLKLGSQK